MGRDRIVARIAVSNDAPGDQPGLAVHRRTADIYALSQRFGPTPMAIGLGCLSQDILPSVAITARYRHPVECHTVGFFDTSSK